MTTLQEIDQAIHKVMIAPDTSDWLKDALANSLKRDCVNAANDAEFLALLLMQRCDAITGRV